MRTIDITTTQNVTIQYELAELRDRILAFILDIVVIIVVVIVLEIFLTQLLAFKSGNIYNYILVGPFVIFYTLFSEIIMNGQTIGKRALGIKVVKINGKEPTVSDYIIRWAFRIPDIWLSSGALAALLISSTPRNQRLGGLLSDTTVVRVNNHARFRLDDILRINSLENYEPSYPDIRFFGDEDMLTIKVAIDRYRQYPNAAHAEIIEELSTVLASRLDLEEIPADKVAFLKTLLSDYIVMTR